MQESLPTLQLALGHQNIQTTQRYLGSELDLVDAACDRLGLAQHRARSSAGQPGTCFDNAAAESFFATLKKELLHRATWPTRQQAQTAIFTYIESFYNRRRRHSTLDYRSPAEFETNHFAATLAA
jgi:transposase InsO family protein